MIFCFFLSCTYNTKFDGIQIEEGDVLECTEEINAFDIEDISVLQDAMSESIGTWNKDAVVLDLGGVNSDVTWRVSAVDILIMIPEQQVPMFQDGKTMQVAIFDGPDPRAIVPYIQELEIHRVDLQWTLYTLPNNASHAGETGDFRQYGAWMRFDFLDIIPDTGMNSLQFVVGIDWPDPGDIAIGYSNFNRSCASNWTDYGEGWVRNSEQSNQLTCSWPMMRIELEKKYPGSCEP